MGKGELAIRIAKFFQNSDEHSLEAVVPVLPEPQWTVSVHEWCQRENIKLVSTGDHKDLHNIVALEQLDIVISVTYDKILDSTFLSKPSRVLNIHNSPLPKYRGVNPINWALKNNEHKHGVTIHEISPGIDDGPILSQKNFQINPEVDEVIDVYERCLHFGWQLFKETIPKIDTIVPVEQVQENASYYSKKDYPLLGDRKNFTRNSSV